MFGDVADLRDLRELDDSVVFGQRKDEFEEGLDSDFDQKHGLIFVQKRLGLNLAGEFLRFLLKLLNVALVEGFKESVDPLVLAFLERSDHWLFQ